MWSRVLVVLPFVASCGKHAASQPPPAKPVNGAPVAFVVDKVTPDKLSLRAYNFGDKASDGYGILIRYYDAKGEVLVVKEGTPFEATWDHTMFIGHRYTCEPKSWCEFQVDAHDVPAGAVRADAIAERVSARQDDLFTAKDDKWPGSDTEDRRWPKAFAGWDRAARKAAWQGAWAGEGLGLGSKAAWEVKDRDVTFFDKDGAQHFTLLLDSPCTAGFSGGKGGWESVYTIKDGELITGLGDAGSKQGDKTIVCGGGSVFVLEGTTCTQWDDDFGRWQSKPGVCGYKDGGFAYTLNNYESKLLVDGDVIWSEQLKTTHAKRFADLAAAKASQGL